VSESFRSKENLSRTAFELKRIWEAKPRVCGVCRVVTTAIEQRVDTLFYENVNDPPTRDAIRRTRGFCRYHAFVIVQQADALGTAIILRDVLTHDLRDIESGDYDQRSAAPGGLARLFDRGQKEEDGWEREIKCRKCPICDWEREVTELTLDSFFDGLADEEFAAAFRQSDGLCVAHFHLASARATRDHRWAKVVETEKAALRRLTEQLAELARKHDYRFKDEPRGEEMTSWRQALNASSGWIGKAE
jgi:hypothetical protein